MLDELDVRLCRSGQFGVEPLPPALERLVDRAAVVKVGLMRVKLVAVSFGLVFGFVLSWSTLSDPDSIRRMLLLQDAYLYLMFIAAIATGFVGCRIVRALRMRAFVTGDVIGWNETRPEPRHVYGAAIFGVGWAISDACPGPIATQVGRGFAWSLCLLTGVVLGITLFFRLRERAAATRVLPSSAGHTALDSR